MLWLVLCRLPLTYTTEEEGTEYVYTQWGYRNPSLSCESIFKGNAFKENSTAPAHLPPHFFIRIMHPCFGDIYIVHAPMSTHILFQKKLTEK